MVRLLALLVILLLMILVGVLALHERPLPQADFTYAIGDSIKTLDPAQMSWNEDIRMALGLWEGLAAYDPQTTEPVAGAAYFPPHLSDDRLTYTFQLRPDAQWSNGDPLRAEDFVYGWRRAFEPGTALDYSFLLTENLAGAKDYVTWRNHAVRVLTLLGDLARGKTLSPENLTFISSLSLPGAQLPTPDWHAIADQFRRNHLAQLDRKFENVALKALDDHRLQVTLVRPMPYFLELAAFSTFLPIHRSIELLRLHDDSSVRDLTMWVFDPQWVKPDYHRNGYPGLITNGAFRLKDWQFKRYMLFEKNPHYWDRDRVKSRTILVRIMTEPSTAFMAYERGEVDWLDDVARLDFAPELVRQSRLGTRTDIHIVPAFGTYFYNFNCKSTLPDGSINPFADWRVRMAFNLAIDKQSLVDNVRKVGNPLARTFIPPAGIPRYQSSPGPDYNPRHARELLTQAGYPQGRGLPQIEILYNTGYDHDKPAQAIAEMWRKNLHVDVHIRGKELKSFAEDKKTTRFMICRASWFGDYGDPTTFLDMLITDNGNNDSAFSYAPYDALMHQAAQTPDPPARLALLAQAEEMLMHQQMPILPLYHYVNLLAFRPHVQGLFPNPRSMYPLKYIYVTKTP